MMNTHASRGDADGHNKPATIATPGKTRNYTGRGYPPEVWAEVRRRHEGGESAVALSLEFGMAAGTIHTRASTERWLRCGGGERAQRETRSHASEDAWAQICRLYIEEKWTASRLAREYKMSESAIRKRLHRNGLSKTRCATPAIVFPDPRVPPPPPPPWETIAHPAQLPPPGDWFTWLFQGGRGAGKTRAGAEWLAEQAERNPNGIFALVGATHHDVREVMIEGPAGLMNLPGRQAPRFESSRRRLVFPKGAIAYAFSSEEPRRLRGPQFDGAWADEFCAWDNAKDTLAMLRFGLRRGRDPRLVITTTPRPIPALLALRGETSCVLTQAPSAANADNLSPRFLEGLYDLYGDTDFAKQELEGEMLDLPERGVWTAARMKTWRGLRPHAFERVIVAVDPPATSGGSACGIVVAGRIGRRAYVLADRSARDLSPLGWAQRVSEAAREFCAEAIVAESNQGGEMVRATIAQTDPPCGIDLVRARYGKRERATPVAMLYEKGLVTHCGAFMLLEEEMMALDGAGEGTFDRADALVWALTVLMFDENEGFTPRIRQL